MIPTRLLAALIQPMLALLLFAGMPVAGADQVRAGPLLQAAERLMAPADSLTVRVDEWRDVASAVAERSDGDDTPEAILTAGAVAPLDRARLIRIGRSVYATAPPRYRPCAAPPTGPPLV